MERPIHRVINLIDEGRRAPVGLTEEQAQSLLEESSQSPQQFKGSFAVVARRDELVLLSRSLDRPVRYFLAKEVEGPMLVIAERIDEIRDCLEEHGYGEQFHPTYTRMVPAHHTLELRLIGCPDPNPGYVRFFDPQVASGSADLSEQGTAYIGALKREVELWLDQHDEREPIGVCFSGGIDSGAVLVAIYQGLLQRGQSPARLKAFTLSVDSGEDATQATEFLERLSLQMLGETLEIDAASLDPFEAVEIIEDYKPLDVECATVGVGLLRAIRQRYPEWRLLADGDGGDENLKDYPIEENKELTIRSVVSNQMLYQEGWGVDAIKHSLTYSGGLSRAYVRTGAPARKMGFAGFSPFTRPNVIRVAESIPFDALTRGSVERLYALKGEVVRLGMEAVYGVDFPVFEKRRFQHGATSNDVFSSVFAHPPEAYRRHYLGLYS